MSEAKKIKKQRFIHVANPAFKTEVKMFCGSMLNQNPMLEHVTISNIGQFVDSKNHKRCPLCVKVIKSL